MNTSTTELFAATTHREPRPSVHRSINGNVYVALPRGTFLVVRPDGGTEEQYTLPGSAEPLVARSTW